MQNDNEQKCATWTGLGSAWGQVVLAALVLSTMTLAGDASACGCLSPPIPPPPTPGAVNDASFAVNQQSESIIFEVEDGFVTAHVLIRYEGAPESFAWIVPVPSVPELALSSPVTFGLLEKATNPIVNVARTDLCPVQEFECKTHPAPYCPEVTANRWDDTQAAIGDGDASIDFGGSASGSGGSSGIEAPPVVVYQRVQVGSYDTVTFGAGEATAAVDWLNENGFITNATMAPYMQPYIDDGMLFVASKLIPGAGEDEIRPLRMRFEAEMPMIPLKLTAIAAEPHLTVTAYLLGDAVFSPAGFNLIHLDETELGSDQSGRIGYPMLLSRAIDEAGGHAFVDEYSGSIPAPNTGPDYGCCVAQFLPDPGDGLGGQGGEPNSSGDPVLTVDACSLGGDGLCQCPYAEFDRADCEAGASDLLEGLDLYDELRRKHSFVTRLTTRLSPEEMTMDPGFLPSSRPAEGLVQLSGVVQSLQACEPDIIEFDEYYDMVQASDCSAVYCGQGECVATSTGAGCVCDPGHAARTFQDLDGQISITCVPDKAPVDFAAGGLELPDACRTDPCGEEGECLDLGGFPACVCGDGTAAVLNDNLELTCREALHGTGTSGAGEYTALMTDVPVCAPAPPPCGRFGWLESAEAVGRHGVICASSTPSTADTIEPPKPTCEDYYPDDYDGNVYTGPRAKGIGCGCRAAGTEAPEPSLPFGVGALFLGVWFVRRRGMRAA